MTGLSLALDLSLAGSGEAAPTTEVVTWNGSDSGANIALSGGNLIATSTAGLAHRSLRATASRTGKLRKFEITVGPVGVNDAFGIANATASLSNYLGVDNSSLGWFSTGAVYLGGVPVATVDTYTNGSIISFEVNDVADLIYLQKSGGSRSTGISIAAITGGLFPALDFFANGSAGTLNAGATAFTIAANTGFSGWNYV